MCKCLWWQLLSFAVSGHPPVSWLSSNGTHSHHALLDFFFTLRRVWYSGYRLDFSELELFLATSWNLRDNKMYTTIYLMQTASSNLTSAFCATVALFLNNKRLRTVTAPLSGLDKDCLSVYPSSVAAIQAVNRGDLQRRGCRCPFLCSLSNRWTVNRTYSENI